MECLEQDCPTPVFQHLLLIFLQLSLVRFLRFPTCKRQGIPPVPPQGQVDEAKDFDPDSSERHMATAITGSKKAAAN